MATISRVSLRWVPLALLGITVASMAALALGWAPWWACRGIAVLFGLFTLTATLIQPAWFWDSRRARRWRRALGDRLYASVLLGLGLVLVYMGLVSDALDRCNVR